MGVQRKVNHVYSKNEEFLSKAEALKSELYRTRVRPQSLVSVVSDDNSVHGWRCEKLSSAAELNDKAFSKGDSCIVDFGDHQVGYVSIKIIPVGSPPDAPLHMRLTFGEMPLEMAVPFSSYDGWISSSWLQQETVHIDVLPNLLELPRRYSFRFLKIEVLDTSQKFGVEIDDVYCDSVTSADSRKVNNLYFDEPLIKNIDKVSIKTLQDCMQDIFEDGPKRDRRLWLGDLRLQALANYETFKNYDLVKRCLYLFAAVPDDNGQVSANVFISPDLIPDDTYLLDYSLIFSITLYEYFVATQDRETVQDLWGTAFRQVEIALERVGINNVVEDDVSGEWWAFFDWCDDLNKQVSAHGILLYTMQRVKELSKVVNEIEEHDYLERKQEKLKRGAINKFWDSESKFFVSGEERQISWSSQIWMVLANVLEEDDSRELIKRLLKVKPDFGPVTPYMYHHLIDALLVVGEKELAKKVMGDYWGNMLQDGADTFWEAYDPCNKDFSPYGDNLINSYCHAWSCTPTYFIRKFGIN